MLDVSLDLKIDQTLSNIDSSISSGKFDAAVQSISEIQRLLKADYFNRGSSSFKPSILKKLINPIIKCASSDSESVSNSAKRLICYVGNILAIINPRKFLSLLQKITGLPNNNPSNNNSNQNSSECQNKANYFIITLPSVSSAIDTFDESTQMQYYSFLFSFIQNTFPNINFDSFPTENLFYEVNFDNKTNEEKYSKYNCCDTIFKIVAKYSPIIELEKIVLNENENDENIENKAIITAKICNNRPEITSQVLLKKRTNFSFLIPFVTFLKNIEKADVIFAQIEKNLNSCDIHQTLQLLNILLTKIDIQENEKIFKKICETLIEKLKNTKIQMAIATKIVNFLYNCVKKGILNGSEILPFVKTNASDDYKIVSLKIMFLFFDDDRVLSVLANFLLTFRNFQTVYSEYLQVLLDNLQFIDDNMLTLIVNESVNPLPLLPNSALMILSFLNRIPKRIFQNENIKVNCYEIVYKYLHNINLQKEINVAKELIKFSKRLNLKLKYTSIDFLSERTDLALLDGIEFSLLNELLNYRLIHPNNLWFILDFIQNDGDHYSYYFPIIVNLLYFQVKMLGFNLPKLYKELNLVPPNEEDHPWILQADLFNMFQQINTIFEKSLFGQLMIKTLQTIQIIYQPNFEGEVATLTSCTSRIFCVLSLDIIEYKINKSGKALKQIIKILTENNKDILPLTESVRISKFAFNNMNVKNALNLLLPYLKEGAEKSREIADLLADHITPQTLTKPVPTFLSFVHAKKDKKADKWKDYVDLCQQIIEPENWIILIDDKEKINNLINHNNGIIEKALDIIKKLEDERDSQEHAEEDDSNSPLNNLEIFEIDEREFHFRYSKIDSEELFVKDREQETKLIYNITNLLWHSKKESSVLDIMTFEELEELALENCSSDINLLIGFFNFCSLFKKQIQLKKWCEAIEIEKYDDKNIFMISLFFENIHCKFNQLPLKVSLLAQNSLTSFGFPLMTKTLLIRAYQQLTGIQWFLVRSLIGIDPEYFKEYPIIESDFFHPNEFKVTNEDQVSLFEYYIGVSSVYFKPKEDLRGKVELSIEKNDDSKKENGENSEMELNPIWFYPTNRIWPFSKMKMFTNLSRIGKPPVKINDLIFEDLINKTKREVKPNPEILLILMNIELTNEQRKTVEEIFLSDNEAVSKFFASQFLSLSGGFEMSNRDSSQKEPEINPNLYFDKPPSFTLKIFRTLLCQFARPISQQLLSQFKLTNVHPALCYESFAKQGIPIWQPRLPQNNFPLSNLKVGILDTNIISVLENVSNEAITAFSMLFKLEENELLLLKEIGSIELIRSDIIKTLLETIVNNNESNVYFASRAMESIKDSQITIDELFAFICNRDFLQSPNFVCAVFVFIFLERMAKEQDRQDILSFCEVLKGDEAEVFADSKKKKFMKEFSNPDVLFEALHINP
ncbi:hypothetical protein TRFO_15963 [Tritrichomonas foetus]|uniref:Uncharacterized protein n=1 Tax=Tritrichomonas foetus TaxID=1144522 RepID=A0A1J4KVV4_9EUKA|nr:hypothetical protein TRFO_15963 [Tritrichomonas foetus]|eukprot:OHT13830.1 hypothetical protein TRFO_15963 [Tritrichomonas foetus]